MNEVIITTGKAAHTAGTSIGIWGWEIPVYLFLGGVTAGIMILAALAVIMGKEKEQPVAARQIILWAPILISAGMLALFIDLSHRLYVFSFYLTFQIASPMSWGAWILVLVYPLTGLFVLATFREGYPALWRRVTEFLARQAPAWVLEDLEKLMNFAARHLRPVALGTLITGVMLGVYTGILLSSFAARPFWNSTILGPLFLVSGLSTGAALVVILARDRAERDWFTKIDLGLIAVEVFMIVLFLIGLMTSTAAGIEAGRLVLGGPLTPVFWMLIVTMGLAFPAVFEVLELRGRHLPRHLASVLVLAGGLALRFVMVYAGQVSSLLTY